MPCEMQISRSRRSASSSQLSENGLAAVGAGETDGFASSSSASSSSFSSSYALSSSVRSAAYVNYIEHRVSKMDTLAGVAIKYGVEVADVKRMNALVTDRQMFAHKWIKIPLPGRHPPSPIVSNGSACNGDRSPRYQSERDLFESFQSPKLKAPQKRVSPAMSSLQGYYGLVAAKRIPTAEGTEMAVYRSGKVLNFEDEPLPRVSPISDLPNGIHKSRSVVNGFSLENGDSAQAVAVSDENGEIDRSNAEKSIRRRQKNDVDSHCRAPELSEDDGSVSVRTGKGLGPRSKPGSRTDLESSFVSAIPTADSFMANGFLPVRRSSSTSNLQESDNGSSMWPTSKWSLKSDVIAKPLFDGLPKPMTVWRNKAALD